MPESDNIGPEGEFRHDLYNLSFVKVDFGQASRSKWFWAGSAWSHIMNDVWLGGGTGKLPFFVGNLHTPNPLENAWWSLDHRSYRLMVKSMIVPKGRPERNVGKIQWFLKSDKWKIGGFSWVLEYFFVYIENDYSNDFKATDGPSITEQVAIILEGV